MVLKSKFVKGTFWSIFGQMFSLILGLVVNIWLAKFLMPSAFGQIAIIMFFISIFTIFTEGGLSGALIRRPEVNSLEYSTVFLFNVLISIVGYLLIFAIAPMIAEYYSNLELIPLLRATSVVLIINAFQFNQNTRMIVEMKFKARALCKIFSVILGAICGILLAYLGYGIWSLVYLNIVGAVFYTIFITAINFKKVSLRFSINAFKELYSFGLNTTLASLINVFFDNIYQLLLAKYFSFTQTGFYYQAKKIQDVPGGIINTLSQSVFFSALAKLQNDKDFFNKVFLTITRYSLITLGLISILIYSYSKLVILLLFGNEWLGSVFYMQVLTFASLFYMQELVNRIVFKIFNKTKQILYLEMLKKVIQIFSIFVGLINKSLELLLVGYIVVSFISYVINVYFSSRILNSNFWSEVRLLVSFLIVFSFMILVDYLLMNYFDFGKPLSLIWILPISVTYLGVCELLRLTKVKEDLKIFKSIFSVI